MSWIREFMVQEGHNKAQQKLIDGLAKIARERDEYIDLYEDWKKYSEELQAEISEHKEYIAGLENQVHGLSDTCTRLRGELNKAKDLLAKQGISS